MEADGSFGGDSVTFHFMLLWLLPFFFCCCCWKSVEVLRHRCCTSTLLVAPVGSTVYIHWTFLLLLFLKQRFCITLVESVILLTLLAALVGQHSTFISLVFFFLKQFLHHIHWIYDFHLCVWISFFRFSSAQTLWSVFLNQWVRVFRKETVNAETYRTLRLQMF